MTPVPDPRPTGDGRAVSLAVTTPTPLVAPIILSRIRTWTTALPCALPMAPGFVVVEPALSQVTVALFHVATVSSHVDPDPPEAVRLKAAIPAVH
jgi:hypothetical protein